MLLTKTLNLVTKTTISKKNEQILLKIHRVNYNLFVTGTENVARGSRDMARRKSGGVQRPVLPPPHLSKSRIKFAVAAHRRCYAIF